MNRHIGTHTERDMKINRSFNCAIEPARRPLDAPPREPEQRPCTDEFIANGGDYERLPGAVEE